MKPQMDGVLSYQIIKRYVTENKIYSKKKIEDWQIQPNTLDLRLGNIGYRVRTSFLSVDSAVSKKIGDYVMYEINLAQGAILEKGCVYVIPLMESLNLPNDIYGKTNPKSSVGRLDVFTRVISDANYRYNAISEGYQGKLYVEISPISFTIKVKEGDSINQLRLLKGNNVRLSDSELKAWYRKMPLLYNEKGKAIPLSKTIFSDGLHMRIDLKYSKKKRVIGFKSKKNSTVIEISKRNYYPIDHFWERLYSDNKSSLILQPEEFYIFASKERVVIPPGLCGEVIPYDPENGEMRVHYAGFFDSGFGHVRSQQGYVGAKAVLEIRPHDVPFLIEDGQIIFRMVFDKNNVRPDHLYGHGIKSSYQCQDLKLSKHFKND